MPKITDNSAYPQVTEVKENDILLGVQDGEVRQFPTSLVGGGGGGEEWEDITNLENGDGLNSLKQKDTGFIELNAYIRPAVVAYLMSLGLTQEQAEGIADSGVEVEGSTKNVLAGLGITGDLNNTVYAALATAFGAGHTIGNPDDAQQGMGSVAMGMGLDIIGKICLGVGKKQTYSVDMFTDPLDKVNARLFLVNLKNAGEFDTANAYTNPQIMAGNADSEVLDFGTMSGDNSFMVGANNVKGLISGAIGNINVITEGVQNCLAVGTQNTVLGHNNFVSGLINCVVGEVNLVSGQNNKTSHSTCGVIGLNLETGAPFQSIFGYYNLKNANALLQVGNGVVDDRSNAFEVLRDGRAKVYGAPQSAEDVVRKQELDTKVPNAPSTNGTYTLKCTVAGGVKTYQWIEDNA